MEHVSRLFASCARRPAHLHAKTTACTARVRGLVRRVSGCASMRLCALHAVHACACMPMRVYAYVCVHTRVRMQARVCPQAGHVHATCGVVEAPKPAGTARGPKEAGLLDAGQHAGQHISPVHAVEPALAACPQVTHGSSGRCIPRNHLNEGGDKMKGKCN